MANNEATSVISTQPTSTPPASTVAPAGAAALRTPDKVSQEALGSEVLQRHLPAFLARPAADLLQVNLDVPTTLATVLGVAPRIRTFRGAIAALMPTYDLGLFDNLEEYAIALNDAHATYLTATKPSDELDAAIEEGTELRALLLADATALVHRGLLDSNALGELKGAFGFKNLATDLHLLAKALGAVLDRSAGRSAVTAEELDRATRLQQHIYRLVGLRAQNEPAASAAGERPRNRRAWEPRPARRSGRRPADPRSSARTPARVRRRWRCCRRSCGCPAWAP